MSVNESKYAQRNLDKPKAVRMNLNEPKWS